MDFGLELEQVLPSDVPQRAQLIAKAARHIELITEANQRLNLTRILDPREAAIKHVLDSVIPWRRFSGVESVLDVGTGAGFPGIPLAIVLPGTRFVLAESIQKKARFVEAVAKRLDLANVRVEPCRAEELLQARRPEIIAARAVAPIVKILDLFAAAITAGSTVLLYKGPDAESEIAQARDEAKRKKVRLKILEQYELPSQLGSRTLVEISR